MVGSSCVGVCPPAQARHASTGVAATEPRRFFPGAMTMKRSRQDRQGGLEGDSVER
jgi:hypothetical protein